ncbi:MAG TPA: hypothetical protein VG294_12340, partial [Solirubrobacteraceae bacterium]|nr:hypothetical protein [Solirubrobacteraceae bacterium]
MADAEAVCGLDCLDGVEELLDHSFLRRVDTGNRAATFTIAQTLRDFGREQLSAKEWLESAHTAHGRWVADLVEIAWRDSLAEPIGAEERMLMRLDDALAALDWARDRDPSLHLRLAGTIGLAVGERGARHQLEAELQLALDRAPERGPHTARALVNCAQLKFHRGDAHEALRWLRRAKELWLEEDEPREVALTLMFIMSAALAEDPVAARAAAEEALDRARASADNLLLDWATVWLAQVDIADGRVEEVEPLVSDALERATEPVLGQWLRHLWADCALLRGDGPGAI